MLGGVGGAGGVTTCGGGGCCTGYVGIVKNETSIRIQAMKIKMKPMRIIVRMAPISRRRPEVLKR